MATVMHVEDWDTVADALGQFIRALQDCDATGGPIAGAHCWFRGCSLKHYDAETQGALKVANDDFDHESAAAVWRAALEQEWDKPPVWFHGDLSAGNLLVSNGKLSAVIDFGACGTGDPACDLVPAWTIFTGSSRKTFEDVVMHDPATWARARGWALWKGLITLTDESRSSIEKQKALAVVRRVIEGHEELQPPSQQVH
ncbi:hypothetical protein NLG97_g11009 [Lecanicillium saksenae]|uniref:Uncharacterized protein n=1 Tax=Lecanicillium saksenae TaxID=468837 RepID=A0ACC1QDA8_9HYPO|nr:hypothetical protein NLG97_g11009 [Lecanicillium saksenae]